MSGARLTTIADAEPTAEIKAIDRKSGNAQLPHQPRHPFEGEPIRFEIDELRADMHRKTDKLNAGQRIGETVSRNRFIEIDAEFVILFSGRDFCMGQRVDIRVHP